MIILASPKTVGYSPNVRLEVGPRKNYTIIENHTDVTPESTDAFVTGRSTVETVRKAMS
ncbi:hypothetical protein [Chelativorans xinjiangense]|uniref:hypothetical protein n=1 Tax=Chelativorans xinjiangense TaxID=2681485 RepID=UPI001915F1A5|nr:hypothetical protein [Chelativorans xinjiangense]